MFRGEMCYSRLVRFGILRRNFSDSKTREFFDNFSTAQNLAGKGGGNCAPASSSCEHVTAADDREKSGVYTAKESVSTRCSRLPRIRPSMPASASLRLLRQKPLGGNRKQRAMRPVALNRLSRLELAVCALPCRAVWWHRAFSHPCNDIASSPCNDLVLDISPS